MRVDATDLTSFDPVEAGVYDFVIVNQEEKTSAAGNQYINWELEVADGPDVNRKVWTLTMVEGKGVFRFEQMYMAVEGEEVPWERNSEGNPIGLNFDPSEWVGKGFRASVDKVQKKDKTGKLVVKADGTPDYRNEISEFLAS